MGNFKNSLKSKNIELVEKINLTDKEELKILEKIDLIKRQKIELLFLDCEFCDIIKEIDLNEINIKKLKIVNLNELFELSTKKNKTIRNHKIYISFIKFLRFEFEIDDKKHHLLNEDLLKNLKKKIDYGDIENKELFVKQKKFDIYKDTIKKAKKYNVEILFDYIDKSKKINVSDFILYFNKRLEYFKKIINKKIDENSLIQIKDLEKVKDSDSEISLIGLVNKINETKNKHYIIEIEDKSGLIKCFINKNKIDLIKIIKNLSLDEGIGIVGKIGENIIWVNDILIPKPQSKSEYKKTSVEEYVAFISDIHFGAKVFVDNAFSKMIDFLNSQTKDEKLNYIGKKIKYIFIAGDIIEGCGVYPNQGKDSRFSATELQYHEAARWLNQIPKDKCIIMIPGNHDTERLSEPQPKLSYSKAYALHNLSNCLILSNPSEVNILKEETENKEGLNFYQYHGGSLFYYCQNNENLRKLGGIKNPNEVVKYLIDKRHLAPSHGSTLYIPDSQKDPLVIEKTPDFFICGHTHKHEITNHKGCTIVSCGCWVTISDYQKKMGMFPDIGKMTIINTKTRNPIVLNFYTKKK